MPTESISRKDFLVTACKGVCGLAVTAGAVSWLAGCAVAKQSIYTAEIRRQKIVVPLTLLEEKNIQVVQAPGWQYNILVVKEPDQTYKALLMKCTHQGFRLTAGKSGIHCNLHGSAFDLEGRVVTGPAAQPLTAFPVVLEKDSLLIG